MLESLYGLSLAQLAEILRSQDWKCAICGVNFRRLSQKARHIDHSHVTGRVRSVLCRACNHMISGKTLRYYGRVPIIWTGIAKNQFRVWITCDQRLF